MSVTLYNIIPKDRLQYETTGKTNTSTIKTEPKILFYFQSVQSNFPLSYKNLKNINYELNKL